MAQILFWVGDNRYVIDNKYVQQVIPRIILKKMTNVPPFMAGLLNLGGRLLPVLDFCQFIMGSPAIQAWHSRIILLSYQNAFLGLIGEKVGELVHLQHDQVLSTAYLKPWPFFDQPISDEQGMIEYINAAALFEFVEEQIGFTAQ